MTFLYCVRAPGRDSVHVSSLIGADRDENRLFVELEFDRFSEFVCKFCRWSMAVLLREGRKCSSGLRVSAILVL